MNNNKQNKGKKKTRPRKVNSATTQQAAPQALNRGVIRPSRGIEMAAHSVCAISNPFCDASRSSKWPDQSSGQSLPVPIRMRFTLTTDANGACALIFTSQYESGIIRTTHSTNGVYSWKKDTTDPDNPLYFVYQYGPGFAADQFRLVTAGVKVTPITSAMNSQGVINMIELPPADSIADYQTINTANKNFPTYETLPLRSTESIYGVLRPSGPEARKFHPLQEGTEASEPYIENGEFTTNDWSSILVAIQGGEPNSAVAIVDVFFNYEMTVKLSSSLGYLTTIAPRANPVITDAATNIMRGTAVMKGNDRTVDDGYLSRALRFLSSNAKPLMQIGAGAAQAYTGNYTGATTTLLSLGSHEPLHLD